MFCPASHKSCEGGKMTEELLKYIIIQLYFALGFLLMILVKEFRKKV